MPETAAGKAGGAQEEQDFILSSLSPSLAQKRLALGVVLFLFVAFVLIAGPLSNLQLARIDAFTPIYGTAMLVNDSITAVLLFLQFSILRSRALVVLACGYLFTALILIPWMLTFPGVFAPNGLLRADLQSTNWLYILWHAGFPTSVLAYALLKDGDATRRLWHGSVRVAIVSSVAITTAMVCGAAILVTAGDELLPRLNLDTVHFSSLWRYAAGFVALLNVLAIVMLWIRRHTVLDLWLMVVMFAFLVEVGLITFPVAARYTVGWYSGRICGFLSASLLLLVLLYEITTLYAREERERLGRLEAELAHMNRVSMMGELAASIAHELNQPLSGVVVNGNACLRWLAGDAPNFEEARENARRIVRDGKRAGDIIGRIRALATKTTTAMAGLDMNETIQDVIALAQTEVRRNSVTLRTELRSDLSPVLGDRVQLQQVVLNLVMNAVEAMSTIGDRPRELVIRTQEDEGNLVRITVQDSGTGLDPQSVERIFDAFYTTKSGGMGMGLSICRSIVQHHGGRLWAVANDGPGTTLQFTVQKYDIAARNAVAGA